MTWINDRAPTLKERLICGFSYLSFGMVGLIYMLFTQGHGTSSFFRFHFYQSILAGLFIMLFNWTQSAFMQILGGLFTMIPGMPMGFMGWLELGFSIISKAALLVLLYGAVFAFLGKLADIPGISKIARMQMR